MDETLALKFLPDEVKEKLEVLINHDLQFVKVPKDILCSSCGSIPLFHYIYPCLHPYCRHCFKNVFQKFKKKCKVCKGELGTRLLQRTSIEYDIYMLKAICPNKRYGCKDVIALNCLLEHIEVCQFTEENQQYNLQLNATLSQNDVSVQNIDVVSAEIRDLKMSISEMKVKIDDFTRSNQSWDKLAQFLLDQNGSLKEQMRQMSLDLKRMQDRNEATTNKIKDKIKLIEIKSRQKDSNVEINVESLKLPTTISAINSQSGSKANAEVQEPIVTGTNIPSQAMEPEVMENRFRKLENTISDVCLSQMAIWNNVDQYIRIIVAAQMLAEDEPVIRETIFKKIEETNIVTKESDLGKLIIDNQLDFKREICLIKKVVENNNSALKHQGDIFNSICDTNVANEAKFQKLYSEFVNFKQLTESEKINQNVANENTNQQIQENAQESRKLNEDLKILKEFTEGEIKKQNDANENNNQQIQENAQESRKLNEELKCLKYFIEEEIKKQNDANENNNQQIQENAQESRKLNEELKCLKYFIEEEIKKQNDANENNNQQIQENAQESRKLNEELKCLKYFIEEEIKKQNDANENNNQQIQENAQESRKLNEEIKILKEFTEGEIKKQNDANENTNPQIQESERQKKIIETLEMKLLEIDSTKERIHKLENSRAIKELVSRNAWNNLNFNDQEEIKSKMEEIRSLKNGTFLWQIENYEKKIKEESIEFSEVFYTSENGFNMSMKIKFGYNYIYPSIEILPGELDRLLPPLIHFRATLSILDQSGRSQKRDRVIVIEPHFGKDAEKILRNYYCCWPILNETEEKGIYLKNDQIFFKAEIEPITSLFRNYFSNDGILVWNIDNYERTKRESIKRINWYIFSDYFYSSESGFRMRARVEFINEDIYFYLLFLVGEFDSKLPSHFNHKCTITLINQKQSISNKDLFIGSQTLDLASVGVERVRERMSYYYCHGMGISQSNVEKEPYLINDKIIVKLVVEAL